MLDDDMRYIIAQSNLSFVATVNEDGSPNLSPKSTLRPFDDTHLIFANLASPGTIKNLRRYPSVEVNCIDVFSRRGYRFSGTGTVRSSGDVIYEEFNEVIQQELGPETKVPDVVLIELTEVKPILSPAYDKKGVTEQGLRKTYLRRYGVAAEVNPAD